MPNDSFKISYGVQQPRSKIGFSQTELQQLGISMVVLTLAFTMMFSGGLQYFKKEEFIAYLPVSAIAVFTAFVCHEMAHKFMAQRYGCWAEFRYWQFGLLIALLFSTMGFLFAAPGAVMIRGHIDKKQNGMISLVGPLSNFAIAGVFTSVWLLTPDSLIGGVLFFIGFINALIGAFNLIPILPFDGAKILSWNIGIYIGMAVIAGALLLGVFGEFFF